MVEGLPRIKEPTNTCESCILANRHRDSFPKWVYYREKTPLELVHTYLCSPMQIKSLGGSYYFLTFIDDYNIKTWVYFLVKKTKTFKKFRELKEIVEK